ncbi:MAG: protein-glutamate O-methyltransferase [Acidobacteriaceae bacterium]
MQEEILSNANFRKLRSLVYQESGICLNDDKKTMLELRVKRRLRGLNLNSTSEYCDYLFGEGGKAGELVHFLDVVTTNKTDFFRERRHFEFLAETVLPELEARWHDRREVVVWSAGCSTGEEPYTLAMVMSEFAEKHPGFRFRVLGTDLSTEVLAKAEQGIYSAEVIHPIPQPLRTKYLMRGRENHSSLVRIVPELRRHVQFRRLNFMAEHYGIAEKVDAVFCRNVIIYFDRSTQEQILQKITRHVTPGGYAFVGHSETLHGMNVPLQPIAPALYRRTDGST